MVSIKVDMHIRRKNIQRGRNIIDQIIFLVAIHAADYSILRSGDLVIFHIGHRTIELNTAKSMTQTLLLESTHLDILYPIARERTAIVVFLLGFCSNGQNLLEHSIDIQCGWTIRSIPEHKVSAYLVGLFRLRFQTIIHIRRQEAITRRLRAELVVRIRLDINPHWIQTWDWISTNVNIPKIEGDTLIVPIMDREDIALSIRTQLEDLRHLLRIVVFA